MTAILEDQVKFRIGISILILTLTARQMCLRRLGDSENQSQSLADCHKKLLPCFNDLTALTLILPHIRGNEIDAEGSQDWNTFDRLNR